MQSEKDWFKGKLILFLKMTELGSNIGEQAEKWQRNEKSSEWLIWRSSLLGFGFFLWELLGQCSWQTSVVTHREMCVELAG